MNLSPRGNNGTFNSCERCLWQSFARIGHGFANPCDGEKDDGPVKPAVDETLATQRTTAADRDQIVRRNCVMTMSSGGGEASIGVCRHCAKVSPDRSAGGSMSQT